MPSGSGASQLREPKPDPHMVRSPLGIGSAYHSRGRSHDDSPQSSSAIATATSSTTVDDAEPNDRVSVMGICPRPIESTGKGCVTHSYNACSTRWVEPGGMTGVR